MPTLKEDAATAAEKLLAETWGSLVPVDPVQIARRLGIEVLNATLNPDVSGALVKEKGRDPTILLNSMDSKNRRRFTCAHEIGHFVKRRDDLDEYEYIDLRDTLSSAGVDHGEMFANNFAANLLMPEDKVRELFEEDSDELRLSLLFDVSREAMHNRLNSLGLI